MAKKRNNSKKESVNVFKVSDGRAKKAKKNKANIKFKKFNTKTNEEVDNLNKNFNSIESDVRHTKPIQKERMKESITPVSLSRTDVNIDEAIDEFSNL